MTADIDRRTFLERIATGGGGLVLGLWLTSCDNGDAGTTTTAGGRPAGTAAPATTTAASATETSAIAGDPAARFDAHVMLRIDGDETITVTVPKVEMGQGVRTSLAMIAAEELDADWSRVRVETAPGDRRYGDQVTGGSLSISTRYDSMRRIGATARHMLIAAAAAEWGVAPEDCTTEPGAVVTRSGDRRATYGVLAEGAAELEPPSPGAIELKDPADFRIIGTPLPAVDGRAIVTGAAVYGSDVMVPGMVHAAVARSRVLGGGVAAYDDSQAQRVPGVLDVVEISAGVAVLADTTWAALQGREALTIEWESGSRAPVDDDAVLEDLTARLDPVTLGPGEMTADYTSPYCPHATMETPTCAVRPGDDAWQVWAATQQPLLARSVVAAEASLPPHQVTLHVPLVGGGFGRRLDQDFVEIAAELAAAVRRPVKLFWSRTDDLRHDRFHPATACRVSGSPADPTRLRQQVLPAWTGPVPTGSWRAVTNVPEAFAHESFLDELAHAAGVDPYEYRRPLLNDRARATLDLAAMEAGWGDPLPAGWGRGIAHHATWGVSPTTAVAEVEVVDDRIRVHRLVMAIDCGVVVNPDTVAAQMEGGVAFAMSAALLGGVTVRDGAVAESNLDDAPILRFDQMPQVDTFIVPSGAPPTGVGEAGVPPVAPAIANAVFAATGRRLRELPLSLA